MTQVEHDVFAACTATYFKALLCHEYDDRITRHIGCESECSLEEVELASGKGSA